MKLGAGALRLLGILSAIMAKFGHTHWQQWGK